MRLDWFLPAVQREKEGEPPKRRSWLIRLAKIVLPAGWFSDWKTKKRGRLRRWLRLPGISWTASPVRRASQAICLILFMALFFWVCWPYDARPAQRWTGFTPVEVDPESGAATLTGETPVPNAKGRHLFVVDSTLPPDDPAASLGWFTIDSTDSGEVRIRPDELPDEARLETLLVSFGPWSLCEQPPEEWPAHYAENLAGKEQIAAEFFLSIDPLVSLSTSIASRSWVWSLSCAAIILAVCIFIPRGFCGYLCPLGTLIDLFDWAVGRRVTRFRVPDDGWWVHIKYYLLLGILVAACGGVLLSGFFAAIPVITRGMLFTIAPLQNGISNGWHQVPEFHWGHILSLILFAAVLALGFLKPRFWCKYVCPSGAVFSVGNLFRAAERKVESSCIHCNKCVEICPFDAIKADFTTRTSDCTMCESCGGVCPTQAIKFVGRWEVQGLKPENDPPTNETGLGRRGFISAAAGTVAGTVAGACAGAATSVWGADLENPDAFRPVRPPGSLSEREFLQACIRCGECFKACPSDVLQPLGFEQGLEGLWTPHVVADWAGCASSCNGCGQVCPTGAIQPLPLEEKKDFRMGLAIVNETTCLPFAGTEACQLCVDECTAAGYNAIEFTQVGTEVDEDGHPIEGTGYLAPIVLPDRCVGCGLCQTRCHGINVKSKGLLNESAIIIKAGEGYEDR